MSDKTAREIFDNLSDKQKNVAYDLIGNALENGDYDREALCMFNKEEQAVIEFLLKEAMK